MTTELSSFAAQLRERIEHARFIPITDHDFNVLALTLFGLQFRCNAAYRRVCDARGAKPDSVGHWSRIPAMPTSAFKDLELTSLDAAARIAVFHSSGTTQQRPSRHFHSAESLALYEASLWPWFHEHVLVGLPARWRGVALTPPPGQAPHSSLVHMFETVRRRTGMGDFVFHGSMAADGSWVLDTDETAKLLREAAAERRRLVLLGTAFSFVHLLDGLAERGVSVQLPAGSRVMETGGYKGRARELSKLELHRLITERLGIARDQIVCEYGMSELSSQAYDRPAANLKIEEEVQHPLVMRGNAGNGPGRDGKFSPDASSVPLTRRQSADSRSFRFPPWARVQIVSPETGREVADGDTGLVRIFDLANVFSVLAVQTEDLAIRCGDGFELIGRVPVAEARGCSLMPAASVPRS